MNIRKLFSIKTFSVFLLFAFILSWGISSAVNNDIKMATSNFSAVGIVKEVTETTLILENASGSTQSSDGTYNLNIDDLKRVETKDYTALTLGSIKVGDKIAVQGLTNGYTFYIKRIVSFATSQTVEPAYVANATTTASTSLNVIETSTANAVVASTTGTQGSESASGATSTNSSSTSSPATEENTASTSAPSTTSSLPAGSATSTDSATTTGTSSPTILDTVTDVIQGVIDTVTETVQSIVDTVTGASNTGDPSTGGSNTDTTGEPNAPSATSSDTANTPQ